MFSERAPLEISFTTPTPYPGMETSNDDVLTVLPGVFTTPTPYPGMETIVIAETERKPTLSKPLTLLAGWRSE